MTPPDPSLLGPLIAQLRLAHGWSQQQLAAALCAAADTPTLTRHEVSRWERAVRTPGERWRRHLAAVLDAPAGLLADVPARSGRPGPAGPVATRSRSALLALAHRWAADPGTPLLLDPATIEHVVESTPGRRTAEAAGRSATDREPDDGRETPPGAVGLAELRRLDDLAGGADLAPAGAYRLRYAVRALRRSGPGGRRRLLPVLAETAQLAGWLDGDAGHLSSGVHAHRLGLRAAAATGDRALAGQVLASASHLLAGAGDAEGGLLLARAGYAGTRRAASPGLRALLLHRMALAAALTGRGPAARRALDAARRAAETVEPSAEPPWLYWLDSGELAAMTGRALVALGRPGPAVSLLGVALRTDRGPRGAAVYGSWLARGLVQLGEVDQAAEVAGTALCDAVRAGSARAVAALAEVDRRFAAHRAEPGVRHWRSLLAEARPFLLSGPRPFPPAGAGTRRASPRGGAEPGGTG
ncbi:helix-turn-helix domain-containing protein [Micromonospora sp. KC213]|uniref:helix-turn-helix domain-containing protein n=1 Tax=Micromonospora sp. KC213 TaxID=2530378 RepID=UPI001043474A|nr:helix-turn-helix domain-containing protein [Micromonospora sp. KC213]TDC32751.1 transcriptional regulator [Micromonospora sp. KC213]